MHKRIVEAAILSAEKSTYLQRVGCVIFKRTKVVSTGFNSVLKHRKKLNPVYQKWPGSVHAEVDAIINAKTDLKGCNLLVIRINKQGEFRLAKPCKECQKYIDYVGIRKVYYSDNVYPHIKELL